MDSINGTIENPVALTLSRIQMVNGFRAKRWHGETNNWTVLEWAGAMCGEAGEAANVAKKLRRFEQGLTGNRESPSELIAKLREEIADTILYAMLLASSYSIDIEMAVVEKFNRKSIEQGFPERL